MSLHLHSFFFLFFLFLFWNFRTAAAQPDTSASRCGPSSASGPLSFQRHVCEQVAQRVEPQCYSQRRWPYGNEAAAAKGIVVLFHGYTACPSAYDPLAQRLQTAGYLVLSFLTVGHGRQYQDCASPSAQCLQGDDIALLPKSRSGYMNYIVNMNAIVRMEMNAVRKEANGFSVSVVGHSLGGALAAYAVAQDPSLYDTQVLLAPFFGLTVPDLDRRAQSFFVPDCAGSTSTFTTCGVSLLNSAFNAAAQAVGGGSTPATSSGSTGPTASLARGLVRSFLQLRGFDPDAPFSLGAIRDETYLMLMTLGRRVLAAMAEGINTFPAELKLFEFVSTPMGWGAGCEADRVSNLTMRKGYCNFLVSNLLAVNSFGGFAADALSSLKGAAGVRRSQFVLVERDGYTRNGIAYGLAQSLYKKADAAVRMSGRNNVGVCMWRIVANNPTCAASPTNECGVPHAMVAEADNVRAGGPMYWNDELLSRTVSFLTSRAAGPFGVPGAWNGQRQPCVQDPDIMRPDPALVGRPLAGINVVLKNALQASVKATVNAQVRALLDSMLRVGTASTVQAAPAALRLAAVLPESLPTADGENVTSIRFSVPDTWAESFANGGALTPQDLRTLADAGVASIAADGNDPTVIPPSVSEAMSVNPGITAVVFTLLSTATLFCVSHMSS